MFINNATSAREWAASWIKYATERRSWGRTLRMLQRTLDDQRVCARSCRSRGQDATAEGHDAAAAELVRYIQHAQAAAEETAHADARDQAAAEAEQDAMWTRLAQKRLGRNPR